MRKAVSLIAIMLLAAIFTLAQQTKTTPPAGKSAASAKAATTQDQKPTGGKPAEGAPQSGLMTKGVAELQRLSFMAGTWKTTEKFEPNEFAPKGGTGTGHAQIHPGPGKMSFVENYMSHNDMMGRFAGHAVIFYDQQDHAYKTFWCDSMNGCESRFSAGKWDGDKLVFTGDSEYQGKKITMRDTFSDIKPDSFTFTEDASTDGGPMKLAMTIQYTRVSRPKPATAPDTKQ